MRPKTLIRSLVVALILGIIPFTSKSAVLDQNNPQIRVSFDDCVSFIGGSNTDYSEFTGIESNYPDCSMLTLADPGYVYRTNDLGHSCTPGINNTNGMCVDGSPNCFYDAGNLRSLRFNVTVTPNAFGVGSIDQLSFYEQAPEQFVFTHGATGDNNYPTRLAIRILRDGVEIHRIDNIETARAWTLREFDLNGVQELTVSQETTFNFEFLAYCPVGNGANRIIWDIEELIIEGNCNRLFAGQISTDDNTQICHSDNSSTIIIPEVTGQYGEDFSWIVVDQNQNILGIARANRFDFGRAPNGRYTIYHIAFDSTLEGLEIGGNLSQLTGCFDLSNGISVSNDVLAGGSLETRDSGNTAYICNDDPNFNRVIADLSGQEGLITDYVITDENDLIIQTSSDSDFDFRSFPEGRFLIYAITHNGRISNLIAGSSLDEVAGCYEISNSITVEKEIIGVGLISIDGDVQIDLCGSQSMMVSPEVNGPVANNPLWLVTDAMGNVLMTSSTLPLDVAQFNLLEVRVYLLSSLTQIAINDGDNISDLEGCFLLSNFVEISNDAINGGIIDIDGRDELSLCLNDNPSPFEVNLQDNQGDDFSWVVTTPDGEILDLSSSNQFDFSDVPAGVCLIWHLSYLNGFQGLAVGNTPDDFSGCYDLSNPVRVTRQAVAAGNIITSTGLDRLEICSGDGLLDSVFVEVNNESAPFSTLVVTDSTGHILEVLDSNVIDFEDVDDGVCLIYNVASDTDTVLTGTDLNVNQLDGCTEISNAITIIRNRVQRGAIAASDGSNVITITSGDALPDSIFVSQSGSLGQNSAWLITDNDLIILDLPLAPPFSIEGIDLDSCLVWHLSYDNIDGLAIGNSASRLSGCYALSNSVKVIKNTIDGGNITTISGQSEAAICLGDQESDTITVLLAGNRGSEFRYVLTDDMDTIVSVSMDSIFTFAQDEPGVCHLYHISYLAGLQGLTEGRTIQDLTGSFSLSNRITITKSSVGEGTITGVDGLTEYNICSGDGLADSLGLSVTGNIGTNSQWIVTDSDFAILELSDDAPADFEGVGAGTCFIYHISYLPGIVGLEADASVLDLSGCFALSNRITINRSFVDGGSLEFDNGTIADTIIVGDRIADSIDLQLMNAVGDSTIWLVTDTAGVISDILTGNPPFDFNDADVGTCLIWNLSFNGNVTNVAIGNSASQIEGCYALSNPLTLVKEIIDGGTISSNNLDICLSDLLPDSVDVMLADASGSNSAWLITDADSTILELPTAPPFDFSSTAGGVCLIWHLSYEDNLTGLSSGNDIDMLMGSFDLSNALTVTRNEVIGGRITLDSGSQDTTLMVGIGLMDSLEVIVSGVNGADTSAFLITDPMGNIIDIQEFGPFTFENAGGGVCQIWFLAFLDGLTGLSIGNNVSDLNGCYGLSQRPVTVTREGLTGGNLLTSDGLDQVSFCVGNGEADLVNVVLTDSVGPVNTWVITDTFGMILDLPMKPPFDFDATPVGACQIWNLAHTADIMGLAVGQNVSGLMGNFNFSNPITVFRSSVDGGSLTTNDGNIIDTIQVNDNFRDLIGVSLSSASGDNQEYIITDTIGNILEINAITPFDLESYGPGVCQIWHISYGDGLTGLAVGNNVSGLSGCFDFSNDITIVKEELVLDGGIISTQDNTTRCAGDGEPDIINVAIENASGVDFNYVLTDTFDIIQSVIPVMSTVNLEQANGGVFRLRHIAYTPGLSGLSAGLSIDDLQGNFDFSNALTIVNNRVDGGALDLLGGSRDTLIMVGDGSDDIIQVNLTGEIGDTLYWLITDDAGTILEIPDAPPFNLENAGNGICQIWNLSTAGTLSGLQVGNNVNQISGCTDLSNPINITRIGISGGMIATPAGLDTANICFVDMVTPPAVDVVLTGNGGQNQEWIITDELDTILLISSSGPPFDFSNIGLGNCNIYHIAYESGVNGLMEGLHINGITGMFSLSNRLSVLRNEAEAGTIMTRDLMDRDTVTVNDGMPDTIQIIRMGSLLGDQSRFVLTDTFGVIMDVQMSNEFIFENQGGGVCEIRSISYNDEISGLTLGSRLSDLFGCFDLSDPVTIVRDGINGGNLITQDSMTNVFVCSNDGRSDLFDVILRDTSGTNHVYILADASGMILDDQIFAPFDFESLVGGLVELYIYNVAYEDGIMGLERGGNIANLTGIFDLSNPIIVTRDYNRAGNIFGNDRLQFIDIVIGEGVTDTIFITNDQIPIGDSLAWLILNTDDEIIDIPAAGPPFTFEDSNEDTCAIRFLTYSTGLTGLEVGNHIDSLQGCFSLSNNDVKIAKKRLLGGNLSLSSGLATDTVCVGDGVDDIISFSVTGQLGDAQDFLVTDDQGVILQVTDNALVNFEGSGQGVCRIYSISYSGTINGLLAGQNIANISGCYALSNAIPITRIGVIGGLVEITGGITDTTLCLNDNLSDFVSFQTNSTSQQYIYLITDTLNVIDTILTTNNFDFANSGEGTCRVYGISYTGSFTAVIGDTVLVSDLSSQCADASGNFVEVRKTICPGIPVLSEISSLGMVEIKNMGLDTIDITGYRLCSQLRYAAIGNLTQICGGSLRLPPDSLVTLELSSEILANFDSADGEMALYLPTGSFDDFNNIVDYVEWGSAGHDRADEAVSAGIWTMGDFVASFSNPNSLLYDGEGDRATDWSAGTPSSCISNLQNEESEDYEVYRIFPNPATEFLILELEEENEQPIEFLILDSSGKTVFSEKIKGGNYMNIKLPRLEPGIYYTRMLLGYKVYTDKFILME